MAKEYQVQLRREIERVALNPTDDERDWEANDIAGEILKELSRGEEGKSGPSV